jgi:hypothetical protein
MRTCFFVVLGLVALPRGPVFAQTPPTPLSPTSSTEEPPPPSPESPKLRSPGARNAGIVLTSIASGLMAAGLSVMIYDAASPAKAGQDVDSQGVATVHIGVPLAAASTVFAGVGIPLWAWGGGSPDSAPPTVPRLCLGAASARLAWSF